MVRFWYPHPLVLHGTQLNLAIVCADEARDHKLHGLEEAQQRMFRSFFETEQLYSQLMTGIVMTGIAVSVAPCAFSFLLANMSRNVQFKTCLLSIGNITAFGNYHDII